MPGGELGNTDKLTMQSDISIPSVGMIVTRDGVTNLGNVVLANATTERPYGVAVTTNKNPLYPQQAGASKYVLATKINIQRKGKAVVMLTTGHNAISVGDAVGIPTTSQGLGGLLWKRSRCLSAGKSPFLRVGWALEAKAASVGNSLAVDLDMETG